jgi:hypothetical protein
MDIEVGMVWWLFAGSLSMKRCLRLGHPLIVFGDAPVVRLMLLVMLVNLLEVALDPLEGAMNRSERPVLGLAPQPAKWYDYGENKHISPYVSMIPNIVRRYVEVLEEVFEEVDHRSLRTRC